MGTKTGIEWTDATWNPVRGCTRVSEGCRNCYAEKVAYRFSGAGQPYEGLAVLRNGHASWTGKIEFVEKHLLDPLKWKAPRRIFVNSMSDLFHENVTDEMRDRIFAVMALCPQHVFQVLTKRPERMLEYLTGEHDSPNGDRTSAKGEVSLAFGRPARFFPQEFKRLPLNQDPFLLKWPLPNVQLGVSVENQAAADERIPLLLQTPAAVRFISAEPLLGPVDLTCCQHRRMFEVNALSGDHGVYRPLRGRSDRTLDWVICGGESGPGARPIHPDWARSLRDQCAAAGVPFFFKQWGEWGPCENGELTPSPEDAGYDSHTFYSDTKPRCAWEVVYRVGKKAAGALLDGREWKQFPGAVHA